MTNLASTPSLSGILADGRAKPWHGRLFQLVALSLLLAVTASFCLAVYHAAHSGLDFTDEGYALNHVYHPYTNKDEMTSFGHVYHLYAYLLDFNIIYSRIFIFFANMILCLFSIQFIYGNIFRSFEKIAFSYVISISSACIYYYWIPVGSYNTLTFHGLLLAACGFVCLCRGEAGQSVTGHFTCSTLIGLGGALVFLGKPPSALLLAPAAIVVIFTISRKPLKVALVASAVAAAVLTSVAFGADGSPIAAFRRYRLGLENALVVTAELANTSLFRFERLGLPLHEIVAFWSICFVTFLAVRTKRRPLATDILVLFVTGTGTLASMAVLTAPAWLEWLPRTRLTSNLLLAAAPLGVALAALTAGWRDIASRGAARLWAVALFLMFAPYIFASGTGNALTHQAMLTAFFWCMAGVWVAVHGLGQRGARVAVMLIAAITAPYAVIQTVGSWEKPYRQPAALWLQDTAVMVGPGRSSRLLLDAERARYLEEVMAALPVPERGQTIAILDMTGESPGVVLATGARPLAKAWMIGGYPGSAELARRALAAVPCSDLVTAWILTSPSGPRALPLSLMAEAGTRISGRAAATIRGPLGGPAQILLGPDPGGHASATACEAGRALRLQNAS